MTTIISPYLFLNIHFSIFLSAVPLPVSVIDVKTIILHEDEEYSLGAIFITDVDDTEIIPKEHSLTLYCDHGTFFSYNYSVSQAINSFSNFENFNFQNREILGSEETVFSNSVIFTGLLYEINSLFPYIFYRPNNYYNGKDKMTLEICDAKTNTKINRIQKINFNQNSKNNSNSNSTQNNTNNINTIDQNQNYNLDDSCVVRTLRFLITPVNNPPVWTSPVVVETEENMSIDFMGKIQINDVDSGERPIFIKVKADVGSIALPFLSVFGDEGKLFLLFPDKKRI